MVTGMALVPMPLDVLAERLTLGPPSVAWLADFLDGSETLQEFVALVREYLPEHEREIMVLDRYEKAERFAQLFEQSYFPLADFVYDPDEAMEQITYQIPVQLGGLTYEDYHEYEDFRPGHILLMSLVVYPYEVLIAGKHIPGDTEAAGAKVALLESVADEVGKDLANRVPPEGWKPEFLHEVCDGTDFAGVADFADWVCGCTNCWMLDAAHDMYEGETWDRAIVDELTEQWPRVKEIQNRLMNMSVWLEEAPAANFEKTLNHILRAQANHVPKEQMPLQNGPKTLMEVFSEEDPAETEEEFGCHIGRAFHFDP